MQNVTLQLLLFKVVRKKKQIWVTFEGKNPNCLDMLQHEFDSSLQCNMGKN